MDQIVSQERTRNYIRQIKASFVFKGLAAAASFFAVPLMIHYLGQEQFGVWSTILSVMSWIVFFDLGIGVGLRNKTAEALAKNDHNEASAYISSGYSLIGLTSLTLFLLMTVATSYIPWGKVFNTNIISEEKLGHIALTSAFFICLNFWVGLIYQILNAVQKTSAVVFGQFLANALALIFVFALMKIANASLLYLAFAYGISMISVSILLSIWFYRDHRDLIPKMALNIRHLRPLLSLGFQFFLIQISVLVIFTTDKILITQLFGPQYVTQYDVVFKLFSVIILIHSLITAPLWSSYTDAYHRGDFEWMKATLRRQVFIFGIVVLAVMAIVPMAKPIIVLWIGPDLEVPIPLVISMGIYVVFSIWGNIFACFVNGTGKIKAQVLSSIIAMLINIPLSIFLTKYIGFGIEGVVWAACVSLSLFAAIGPFQVFAILKNKAA